MAHVEGRRTAVDEKAIDEILVALARAAEGKPVALVAQAALDLCLGIWSLDPTVTRDMALQVVTSQIDARFKARSN